MKNQKLYVSVIIIVLAIAGFVFVLSRHVQAPVMPASTSAAPSTSVDASQTGAQDLKVSFDCDAGKTMSATFHLTTGAGLDLSLSDGRTLNLMHVDSADGTDTSEYATADGNIILWSKGQGTYLQEGAVTTYSNCQLQNDTMATTPPAAQ